MLGKITKIASAAHGATVAKRFFQRFSFVFGDALGKTVQSPGHGDSGDLVKSEIKFTIW